MDNSFWSAFRRGRSRRLTAAKPALERLEPIVTPAYAIGNLTITNAAGATITEVSEPGTVRLSGKYTALASQGRLALQIDWGDGGAVQTVALGAYGTNVPFGPIAHTYADDVGDGPLNALPISVSVIDSGPADIPDSGVYSGYDIPWIDLNLKGGVVEGGLTGNSSTVSVDLNQPFHFYGADYNRVTISDNGLLYLGSPTNPSPSTTNTGFSTAFDVIAPLGLDIVPSNGGVLWRHVDFDGDGTSDYFVVEWNGTVAGGGTDTVQFQAMLQLGTNSSTTLPVRNEIYTQGKDLNGDIIFNYRDTDITTSTATVNYGAGAAIGINRPTNKYGTADGITGNYSLPGGDFAITGNKQAVRLTAQNPRPDDQVGADGVLYKAFRSPFETRINLTRFNSGVSYIIPVGTNDQVFDDTTNSVPSGLNTFRIYNQTFGGTGVLATASDNGLLTFLGSETSPANGSWPATPTSRAIAALWDNWGSGDATGSTGQPGPGSRVLSRLVDIDNDGDAEYCIVEWSLVFNRGLGATTPTTTASNVNVATFQAILQLNTGSENGAFYLNYADTDVNPRTIDTSKASNTAFDNGASATAGVKDASGPNSAKITITPSGPGDDRFEDKRALLFLALESATATTSINVRNVAPTFTIVGGDQTITEGGVLTNKLAITDVGALDTFDYTVTWGDGTSTSFAAVDRAAASQKHQYADNGVYTIAVSSFLDKDGNTDGSTPLPTQTVKVTVTNVNPTLPLQPDPIVRNEAIRPGQMFARTGFTVSDPGFTFAPNGSVETINVTVNWGDGSADTVIPLTTASITITAPNNVSTATFNLSHQFSGLGTFLVTITAADDDKGSTATQFYVGVGSERVVAAGADAGGGPQVRVYDARFLNELDSFFAYDQGFLGGVRVAVGDVNGDSLADIVTAPGPGGGPNVRVFSGLDGSLISSFFAYAPGFTGGVYVAVGDVNGDGRADIITGAGAGGGPNVRVFSGLSVFGGSPRPLRDFFAYSPSFTGGVSVAAGDLNKDGKADIVVGAGPGGGPHVQAFSGANNAVLYSFFPYAVGFRGGVNVAVGDTNGDGYADIVTGPGLTGGPHLRIFSGQTGGVLRDLFPFAPGSPGADPYTGDDVWSSGLRIAVSDIGHRNSLDGALGDGYADLIVGPGAGRKSKLLTFSGKTGTLADSDQQFGQQFGDPFLGGVWLGGN